MPVTADHRLDHTRLQILTLAPGETYDGECGPAEWILLPLAGACRTTVTPAGGPPQPFELHGRESVFTALTDFAYLPRGAAFRVESPAGGRFALAGAPCTRELPARHAPAAGVPVELRGTGTCSRQVNNFAAADVFDCDRLIAVEVLTPGGNWSSYPPHKHDEDHPGEESRLEEIYYYEVAPHGTTPGVGYQRVTPSPQGRTDVLAEVRTGDAVLIPDGWHGPSIAAPGHTLYYLNVMAGPGATREWLIRDHPDHAWIRTTWPDSPADPRLPLYTHPEPAHPEPAHPEPAHPEPAHRQPAHGEDPR
ncbi:5-deoxy-glucuronate isomerase [Streptomyces bambusae]|uniref:5-deoxy-glucuronate isomerase n=1 Tax=Streptomyces bambusae TaxID=1550616 RepID=UPI001CFF62BF|nr:5-deoxy-glucuronate isomerase [Streptomyces bambusae]MCB5169288.1 5-deoxy-glucuronate isomerase [Streptomyces bambusae]